MEPGARSLGPGAWSLEPRAPPEKRRHVIVRLDLGHVGLEGEAQGGDELLRPLRFKV